LAIGIGDGGRAGPGAPQLLVLVVGVPLQAAIQMLVLVDARPGSSCWVWLSVAAAAAGAATIVSGIASLLLAIPFVCSLLPML